MKKIAIIFLALYPIVRIAFHLINTDCDSSNDAEVVASSNMIAYQLYFIANSSAMVGFFALLYSIASYLTITKSSYLRSSIISLISFKNYTLSLFIYSSWCFIVDILMLFGYGNKDSILYTGISIILLFLSLWSFTSKH